jgi:hypothetical protein
MHRRIEENLAGQSDRFPDFDRHCGREYATDDQGIRELHRAGPARQRAHGVAGVISPVGPWPRAMPPSTWRDGAMSAAGTPPPQPY